jgi:very-short-patch-repair endonuclease
MRKNLLKNKSTKAERIFAEALKRNRIPFLHRTLVGGREVDFLIGKWAVEIDGHEQDRSKNKLLLESGYSLLHLRNAEIRAGTFTKFLPLLWPALLKQIPPTSPSSRPTATPKP